MSQTVVSILICTRDRADDLRQTLEAIGRTDLPAELTAEIVVADNGSRDHTQRVVSEARLANGIAARYVAEPRRGKGYAYHRAIASARGEILLFTDDDVRPPQDWIQGMCEPILSGRADAVAGGVRIPPHLDRPWLSDFLRVWVACTDGIDSDRPTDLVGANMAISRRVFAKVPGFDVELGPGALGFCDETLFAWQMIEAGYRIAAALDVCVEHHFSPDRLTPAHFATIARRMGRSRAYLRYHWEQTPMPHPRLQALWYAIDALASRILRWRISRADESPDHHEMYAIFRREFARGYLLERRRVRQYTQRGLVKLSSDRHRATDTASLPIDLAPCPPSSL